MGPAMEPQEEPNTSVSDNVTCVADDGLWRAETLKPVSDNVMYCTCVSHDGLLIIESQSSRTFGRSGERS